MFPLKRCWWFHSARCQQSTSSLVTSQRKDNRMFHLLIHFVLKRQGQFASKSLPQSSFTLCIDKSGIWKSWNSVRIFEGKSSINGNFFKVQKILSLVLFPCDQWSYSRGEFYLACLANTSSKTNFPTSNPLTSLFHFVGSENGSWCHWHHRFSFKEKAGNFTSLLICYAIITKCHFAY